MAHVFANLYFSFGFIFYISANSLSFVKGATQIVRFQSIFQLGCAVCLAFIVTGPRLRTVLLKSTDKLARLKAMYDWVQKNSLKKMRDGIDVDHFTQERIKLLDATEQLLDMQLAKLEKE